MSTYEISKSSLLSLKAEILKKQDEVSKAKLQNKAKVEQAPKKSKPLEIKNKGVDERQANDTVEDENLLQKSKDVLQQKAKLYDQLSKGKKMEGSERFLVQFGRKLTNAKPPDDSDGEDYNRYPESDEERHFSDEYEPASNRGDDWVEYVDCLGRTRNCLRKDLEYVKQRDSHLITTIRKDEENKPDKSESDTEEKEEELKTEECSFNETSELLSNDMKTELMRQKWEQEEEELRKKSDLHYQDILFDEARVHGVGYYGFSKDEQERAKQQEALKKLRQETQQQQKKAEDMRKMRDKQLAMRARAARNRKRARMGLPPEEEGESEELEVPTKVSEEIETPTKTLEELEAEKKREEQRQNHVRPWDIGKDGVKEHVELTQEEWNRKKRKERIDEFAPSYKNNDRKDYLDTSRPPPRINNPFKRGLNPYKTIEEKDYKEPKRFESRPIVNEYSDVEDSEDELMKDYLASKTKKDENRGRGPEIAPPPTYDYYGPSGSKRSKVKQEPVVVEDSISAGLKFLRQQAEKKKRNRDDDMFIM